MGKRLVIDLDGTICEQKSFGSYQEAKPHQDVIDKLWKYADAGWHITIFTARGMDTFQGHTRQAKKELGPLTRTWLKEHKVPFHSLKFGKPPAIRYIDDRAWRPDEFVQNDI